MAYERRTAVKRETIYDEYGELVFRFLITLTKNKQIAEELTHLFFNLGKLKIGLRHFPSLILVSRIANWIIC